MGELVMSTRCLSRQSLVRSFGLLLVIGMVGGCSLPLLVVRTCSIMSISEDSTIEESTTHYYFVPPQAESSDQTNCEIFGPTWTPKSSLKNMSAPAIPL